MDLEKVRIHIIGAGISGLTAAICLEQEGFFPVVWEASDRVGGRLKTDHIEGYQLDRGFQVLLDAYPKVKEFLNVQDIDLQRFKPGSIIFSSGNSTSWGDPLRDASFWSSPFAFNIAGPSDGIKLLKHRKGLQRKSLEEIFEQKESSTMEYLQSIGFSEKIINNFFRPFFAGIFLESELKTSNRMFDFVFKMFGEGYATIPKEGIEAVAKQLKSKLKKTTFHFNTKVDEIKDKKILLEGIDQIDTDYIIVATEADKLLSNLKGQGIDWKYCHNLYFEIEKPLFKDPIIALQTNPKKLINNFHFPQSLVTLSRGEKELISVTVVNDKGLSEVELAKEVEKELMDEYSIKTLRMLKHYHIPKALPQLTNLQHDLSYTATQITPSIYLAGDQLLNGSLNAAMTSGERAAEAINNRIKGIST